MKFIIVVVGVLMLSHMGSLSGIQRDNWYQRLVAGLTRQGWLKPIRHGVLCLSILLPVLCLLILLFLLGDHWLGLPQFILSLLVFLYALGRGDLAEQVNGYKDDLKRDDLQAAYHDAAEFNSAHQEGSAENWKQLHAEALRAISYRYFERYFAVMFWFILAGAPGALLYRLSVLHADLSLDEDSEKSAVVGWERLVEWLPARILGLSLAFVGNFSACLNQWRETLFSSSLSTDKVVAGYVESALQAGEGGENASAREAEVGEIEALFSRTLIFSVCVIALLVVLI